MTTTDQTIHSEAPEGYETLREFLTSGGDLTTYNDGDELGGVIHALTYGVAFYGVEHVESIRRQAIRQAWEMYGPESSLRPDHAATCDDMWVTLHRYNSWVLEALASDDLAAQVLALDPERVAEERAQLESDLAVEAQPFTLTLEHREDYRCGLTGERRTGEALVLTGQGWYGDETHEVADRLVFDPEALQERLGELLEVPPAD